MLWQGGMIDFKLFGGFGFRQTDRQTDRWTNERTLVVVESLSRLKIKRFSRVINEAFFKRYK